MLRLRGWAAVLAAFGIAFGAAKAASAEVRLAPSRDGYLGAWLVAGPLSSAQGDHLDLARVVPRTAGADGPRFRMLDVADGALDLKKALGVDRQNGSYALVAGTLELERDLSGWLLVGADGTLIASVDGARVLTRTVPALRDRGWDVVPLELARGAHRIVFLLRNASEHWAFIARVLDKARFLPPRGASLLLEGTTDADAERLSLSLQTQSFWTGLDASGYHPGVAIEYRRGAPRRALDISVQARLGTSDKPLFEVRAGRVALTEDGVQPLRISLPPLARAELNGAEALRLQVRTGGAATQRNVFLDARAPAAVERAERWLGKQEPSDGVVRATLEKRLARVQRLGAGPRASAHSVARALERLESWLADLEQGVDPLHRSGLLRLARRSELDGRPQRFALYVPKGFDPAASRKYPLVVVLHGYDGNPTRVLSAFFDSSADAPAHPVAGFVLAPHAHGNAFYRGPGEHELMSELAWVLAEYPIDELRITITGVSMGGTGTAQIALNHASTFAAASPLCGYHSYFVRRDIAGRPIRPWEREEMQRYSPASLAENGLHLPMLVAHGLKDLPLENSRVLIGRYRALGYSLSEDWPDTGHAVWTEYWKGGRMWPLLARYKRDPDPARVVLKTDSLRHASNAWVAIRTLAEPGRMAQLDARIVNDSRVDVQTSGVLELALSPPESRLPSAQPRTLVVNGQALSYGANVPLIAHDGGGTWLPGAAALSSRAKHAHVEGPLADVFFEPLVCVYGSLSAATLRANRELCQAFVRLRNGVDIRFPVLADREVTPELERSHALLLVGSKSDNALVAALDPELPIGISEGGLRFGERRMRASEIGTLFVYPNPRFPDRILAVLEAPTLPGLFRALSLPQMLPDFVVYDARLAPAAGQQVLGAAEVLEAGYFRNDWSLPSASAASANAASVNAASANAASVNAASANAASVNAASVNMPKSFAASASSAPLPERGANVPHAEPAPAPGAPDAGLPTASSRH